MRAAKRARTIAFAAMTLAVETIRPGAQPAPPPRPLDRRLAPEDPDFWAATGRAASPGATWSSRSSPSTSASRSGACGRCSCSSSAPTYGIRPGREVPAHRRAHGWSARSCGCRTRSRWPGSAAATGRSSARCCCWCRRACAAHRCSKPGVSFTTLLLLAAVAGVGGGNFASSMANINAFYPQRLKGWALGLNAGGGNLGVAAVQLVGLPCSPPPAPATPAWWPAIYIPLIVLAALLRRRVHGQPRRTPRNDKRGHARRRHATRTPGSCRCSTSARSARSSASASPSARCCRSSSRPTFDTPVDAAYLTFLGPLLGSLIRPVGGALADRLGGARVTLLELRGDGGRRGAVVLLASRQHSLPLFLAGFLALFVFTGIGNGSTYKMIPAIFRAKAARDTDGTSRPRGGAPAVRRADRHRRRDRRLRRRAGQPRVPPVVPGVQDRRRRLPRLHRLLRRLLRGHLGRLPAPGRPGRLERSLRPVLTCGRGAGYRCLLLCDDRGVPIQVRLVVRAPGC